MKSLAARLAILAVFLAAPIVAGCSAQKDYVDSDLAKLRDVGPRYAKYVAADASLPDPDKATYLRSLKTWKLRIEKQTGEPVVLDPETEAILSGVK